MKRKQAGAVMVVALAVLTGLVAVLAAAAATQRVAFRAGLNRLEARRAELVAESACQFAMASLVTQSKTSTLQTDDWAKLGQGGDERFTVGDEAFRIEVKDAAALINLNTASQAQLQQLNLTDEQIASLLDWRSPGQTARTNGAKDEYYNALPTPYNTALQPLKTLDEILLVKGFTAEDLNLPISQQGGNPAYTGLAGQVAGSIPVGQSVEDTTPVLSDLITLDSVSQDVAPNGQPKLNVNTNAANFGALVQRGVPTQLAAAIIQRRASGRPFANFGQILALPGVNLQNARVILDNLSVTGNARAPGKINLNTATEATLATVPGMTADLIQGVIQQQATGFSSLGQLASVPGITMDALRQSADTFGTNSQAFIVRISAESGATRKMYEGVVSIEGTAPRLVRVRECPENILARWGWAEDASTETPLEGGASQ